MRRRVGVIGAGPGGICTGYRLKEAGYDDFVILEQAPGVGGTWWHNAYPGCACDVPSYLYSFSFAQQNDWPHPYGTQPEVQAYLEDCVARFGLTPHLRLNTRVEAARWDDAGAVWHLTTNQGEVITVDILVSGVGLFNLPVRPKIAGLDEFAGTMFHSARWNHDHDLSGETVAVIGSAASAVQFIPEIAKTVGHLDIYQRTPNWVRPRGGPYTDEQRARFRADPAVVQAERDTIWHWVNTLQTYSNEDAQRESVAVCLEHLKIVADPETRARLTPDHQFGCKRPLISNDWYPTFNRPNVALVTDAIARVTSAGIVTVDGTERPADAIILATGFDTARFLSAIPVTGRGGRRLADAWVDGAEAYLGITVSGFPNLFMLYGPNTNNGSIIFQIECQVGYALAQIRRMGEQNIAWIDVKPAAMADYNRQLQGDMDTVSVWRAGGCSEYYRDASGKIVTQWPHGMDTYRDRTATPDPDAYEHGQRHG